MMSLSDYTKTKTPKITFRSRGQLHELHEVLQRTRGVGGGASMSGLY